ncbi:MAG TPA: DUF484 family protein [Rhizomicrobium sp.]|nr:DUF484 family protein [Rhizomicrobium sp.]
MSESATAREPALAAAEAVKAFIRMNRARLAEDGELLALLLPERFETGEVRDLQRFVIERLKDTNADLRRECDALRATRDQSARLSDGVKRAVLELLDARRFEEAIAAATDAAQAFGADRAALCVEAVPGAAPVGSEGVRLIPPGTAAAILGGDGLGAILSGGGEILFGHAGAEFRSLAVFRLRIGRDTPAAVYALGAREAGRFEAADTACDLSFFARALERAIRAWLDLPKL